ncbi:hypothetical protein CDAR_50421 [Caerostris darwini]|uniref:Uncharacterized protein n=1 Tax=Caerostris darwini TaxID=1538125 RepID=A0AAV4UXD2_9ARAC|nr:hypothetical protein CDAR_50421 [Caerostris darwini]
MALYLVQYLDTVPDTVHTDISTVSGFHQMKIRMIHMKKKTTTQFNLRYPNDTSEPSPMVSVGQSDGRQWMIARAAALNGRKKKGGGVVRGVPYWTEWVDVPPERASICLCIEITESLTSDHPDCLNSSGNKRFVWVNIQRCVSEG